MRASLRTAILLFPALALPAAAQSSVHVNPNVPTAPRPLETQTEHAAVRDYLQSWKAMRTAFESNRSDLLNGEFVGNAMNKLSRAIHEQSAIGVTTNYQALSHDIQFLFYSPEGLSIEFTDSVKYNLQVYDHGRLIATRRESARYLVVMTPSEVRWRVRVFQGI